MSTKVLVRSVFVLVSAAVMMGSARGAAAQGSRWAAETAQIMKADAELAAAVAQKNRERFLALVAEETTFNGGTTAELHGRESVSKGWNDFFEAGGPTLAWTPTHVEVVGAGDLGYTTGRSVFTGKGPNGAVTERRGEYLTVWRKQRDGTWKVIFDTGSTLPPTR